MMMENRKRCQGLQGLEEESHLNVDTLFFSRVLQRAGNALLKEVNYYGLLC